MIRVETDDILTAQREMTAKVNGILDNYMDSLIQNTIIFETRALARAANLPDAFVEGIRWRKTGPNRGQLVNTWGTEEKPLARFFNYGTRRHWVEPSRARALAWRHKTGKHAQAVYFRGQAKEGDMLFSKGHYVSGVPRTEVMERGLELGRQALAAEARHVIERELAHVE